jgi:hypothetical protein
MVAASRFGPAVIGLLRPVIVLPEMIVQGKSPADLEPILAHELIHVRRGDLWVGMLQTLAVGLWWFHPLVWLASRWISREAERCCDEAVLATLRCAPARYARCLLDVLDRKQSLRSVPAFPGVRPAEVTSRRLERIMQLGQGSRPRTPWWCWLVLVGLAAATLPGAAWVAAEQEVRDARPARSEPIRNTSRELREYDVTDIVAETSKHFGFSSTEARQWIADDIMVNAEGNGRREVKGSDPQPVAPQVRFKGTTLVVRYDEQGHQRVAQRIDQIRRYGFERLLVQAQLISARPETVEKAGLMWQLLPVDLPGAADGPLADFEAWRRIRSGRAPAAPSRRSNNSAPCNSKWSTKVNAGSSWPCCRRIRRRTCCRRHNSSCPTGARR